MSLELPTSEKSVRSTTRRVNPIDRLSSVSSKPGEIIEASNLPADFADKSELKLCQYISGYNDQGKAIYQRAYLNETQKKKFKAVEVLDAVA